MVWCLGRPHLKWVTETLGRQQCLTASRSAVPGTWEAGALLLLGGVPRQAGYTVLVLEVICCLHIARELPAFPSSSEVYPVKLLSPRMAFGHLQDKCQPAKDFWKVKYRRAKVSFPDLVYFY